MCVCVCLVVVSSYSCARTRGPSIWAPSVRDQPQPFPTHPYNRNPLVQPFRPPRHPYQLDNIGGASVPAAAFGVERIVPAAANFPFSIPTADILFAILNYYFLYCSKFNIIMYLGTRWCNIIVFYGHIADHRTLQSWPHAIGEAFAVYACCYIICIIIAILLLWYVIGIAMAKLENFFGVVTITPQPTSRR